MLALKCPLNLWNIKKFVFFYITIHSSFFSAALTKNTMAKCCFYFFLSFPSFLFWNKPFLGKSLKKQCNWSTFNMFSKKYQKYKHQKYNLSSLDETPSLEIFSSSSRIRLSLIVCEAFHVSSHHSEATKLPNCLSWSFSLISIASSFSKQLFRYKLEEQHYASTNQTKCHW